MKRKLILLTSVLAATLGLHAQNQPVVSTETDSGQVAGLKEITLGGGGASNKALDNSFGSLDFSLGSFSSPRGEWLFRQSASYANPDNARAGWNASSRLGYDYHLSADGTMRPFVGVNAGRVYGNAVNDSWTAGLEAGAKIFVKPQTFIYLAGSYDWLFDRGNQIDNQFDAGRFGWSAGVGYQF